MFITAISFVIAGMWTSVHSSLFRFHPACNNFTKNIHCLASLSVLCSDLWRDSGFHFWTWIFVLSSSCFNEKVDIILLSPDDH
jgi:hypothetical protein